MPTSTCASARTRQAFRMRTKFNAGDRGCVLAVLLASHVNSKKRLRYLSFLLNSIAEQVLDMPEGLYVSWYATDEALACATQELLSRAVLPLRVRTMRQARRLTQYQHFRKALTAFERDHGGNSPVPAWLLFTDDDDLWHPQRVHLTRRACSAVTASGPSAARSEVCAISFGVYAYPLDEAAQEAKGPADVDRLIASRQAGLWLGSSEIFQYAVRPAFLARFLCAAPAAVLAHTLCDVRFAQWMRQENAAVVLDLDQGTMPLACGEGCAQSGGGALVSLGAVVGTSAAVSEAESHKWLSQHWHYFYRNQRQASTVHYLGDLEDLRAHQAELQSSGAHIGPLCANEAFERASTGDGPVDADRAAARRVLDFCVSSPESARGCISTSGAREDEARLHLEEARLLEMLGRLRHHAELAVLLCMHFRNAAELAREIARDGRAHDDADACADGSSEGVVMGVDASALDQRLKSEQERFVDEALERFEHAARRNTLPMGTVQQCLA